MANRLSRIYTRKGDKGDTRLGDGSKTKKDSLRVNAYGTVDELNSVIGLLLTHPMPELAKNCFAEIQHHLFDLGGELCIPGHQAVEMARVSWLEKILDKYNEELPPLKEFILPGGSAAAATCHLARTVCRRAERETVALSREEAVNEPVIAYLNRLSDLLFVIARVLARADGGNEVVWQHDRELVEI